MGVLDFAIDDRVFITNSLDAAVQELDILFNTYNTELIGNADYGTNFEQFLWQLTPAEDSVKEYIYSKISNTYFLSKMKVDIDVDIEQGSHRNIYNITITVGYEDSTDETTNQKRIYQFR